MTTSVPDSIGTTMRDIADAAGMSLGAAYYYFPSKEALVFAYSDENQAAAERLEPTGTLREQLGSVLHAKLRLIKPYRQMLGTIRSAFSAQTRDVRRRSIEIFARPLRASGLSDEIVRLGAHALWMFQLGAMLLYLDDTRPGQKRTHGLVDDTLDMVVPMLPLLSTPMGRGERVTGALDRAGVAVL